MDIDATLQLEKLKDKREMLLEYQEKLLSETDTRCKIVDFLFKDILSYDEGNICREEHYRKEINNYYIDYIFETDSNKFLVEAKKSGRYFNIPIKTKKGKMSGVLSSDKSTKEALEQAYKYCLDKNINVGCISNGLQIIVFLCNSVDKKYNSYVFNGIDDIINDFVNFYNIFSPYSNGEFILNKILKNDNNDIRSFPQIQKKVSNILYNFDQKINRNPIDVFIQPMLDTFFSDLVSNNNIKYLDECYCTQDNIDKYNRQLRNIFADRIPHVNIPVQDSGYFQKDFESRKNKLEKDPLITKQEVMLVIGGVGSGKTTFLYRFFHYILPKESKEDLIWIHIDFIKESREDIDVKNYVYNECLKQLREKYQHLNFDDYEVLKMIYKDEIDRLKNGALKPLFQNDRNKFEEKISELLYEKIKNEYQFAEDILKFYSTDPLYYRNICITLDNADQKSEEFQIKCITAAYDISNKINSLVVLSMRESSYWKLRNVKPLDAYRGNAYHISTPSISTALGKRIDVASKHLSKEVMELEQNGGRYKIEMKKFLEILRQSIFMPSKSIPGSRSVAELFDHMAANNFRFAMEMLETFLTSGHTNTEEYIKMYLTNGQYIIPYHAFVRSISLGDFKYYHSDKSLFINIMEIDNDGFYSHFTKLRVLKYLSERITVSSLAGAGFLEIEATFNDFKYIFNNIDSFKQTLNILLSKRLIATENGYIDNCYNSKYIKISSAGYYYLNYLINEFSYLERLCEDTSVSSNEYFKALEEITLKIENMSKSNNQMKLRVERVNIFLEYLKQEEQKEKEYVENSPINYSFMYDIISSFNIQKDIILNSNK